MRRVNEIEFTRYNITTPTQPTQLTALNRHLIYPYTYIRIDKCTHLHGVGLDGGRVLLETTHEGVEELATGLLVNGGEKEVEG